MPIDECGFKMLNMTGMEDFSDVSIFFLKITVEVAMVKSILVRCPACQNSDKFVFQKGLLVKDKG